LTQFATALRSVDGSGTKSIDGDEPMAEESDTSTGLTNVVEVPHAQPVVYILATEL